MNKRAAYLITALSALAVCAFFLSHQAPSKSHASEKTTHSITKGENGASMQIEIGARIINKDDITNNE